MPKRNLIWIVAVLLAALVVTWTARNHWPVINSHGLGAPSPLDQAAKNIRENWLGEIDAQELRTVALTAMVDLLDEHSSYMTPAEVRLLASRLEGTVHGFGLTLARIDGDTVVVAPLFNSPAYHAGILPGDRILSIDGLPVDEAMPGPWDVGSDGLPRVATSLCSICPQPDKPNRDEPVELTIVRDGKQLPPVVLHRQKFAIETVTGLGRGEDGRWIYTIDQDSGIAYVRISELANKATADDLLRAMREMPHADKLILDLRDNPGGPLDVAVSIADMFLSAGPIVTQLSRTADPGNYIAHKSGTFFPDIAMVVLVNAGTASAAEIVAGALADNGRAVLLGEPTLGKRTIQEMLPLPGGGQLILTTSRYVFGLGDADDSRLPGLVDHQPIIPHVRAVARDDLSVAIRRGRMIAALGPHNKAAHRLGGRCPPAAELTPQELLAVPVALDAQLARAIDLLNSPQRMQDILTPSRSDENANQIDETGR